MKKYNKLVEDLGLDITGIPNAGQLETLIPELENLSLEKKENYMEGTFPIEYIFL